MNDFLTRVYFSNTFSAWLTAAALALVIFLALWSAKKLLLGRFRKRAAEQGSQLTELLRGIVSGSSVLFFLVTALFLALQVLEVSPGLEKTSRLVFIIALLLQAGFIGNRIIAFFLEQYRRSHLDRDAAGVTTVSALAFAAKLVLWALVLLLALDNLGINVTGLVAGLGIGGIAVALAAQSVLGDLFASLSIVLDKPFVIGDFIILGNELGTVEHIGLKTTRIKSLSGEQLIIGNADLLNSRIRNFKRMTERRALFSIGVTYQTSPEKLAAIPGMLREIIEKQENLRFERAHFKEFADFALVFEVVYWVLDPAYAVFMDRQQEINLEIARRFAAAGIEFAYPTQTVFLAKNC